jgi:hypothetical protein
MVTSWTCLNGRKLGSIEVRAAKDNGPDAGGSNLDAQWREFEKLIARIEQAMAPSGAVVTSPDRIPDKVTGELREVDVSIRYKVGTCPILVTIECRNRSGNEDVTWIEQIAEKKRSIGASMTLAVSSSGFSDSAIKKASVVGIEIRTLDDALAEDFREWLAVQHVVLDVREWSLAELALEVYDAPEDAELIPALQKSFRESGHLAPIFIRNLDGKRFHVENILIEWSKRNGDIFPEDIPSDGTRIRRNLHQPLDRNCLHLETTKGNFDLRVIHIGLWLSHSKALVPVSKLTKYSAPSAPLVQTAEWNLRDMVRLSLHRNLESGETKVVITSEH